MSMAELASAAPTSGGVRPYIYTKIYAHIYLREPQKSFTFGPTRYRHHVVGIFLLGLLDVRCTVKFIGIKFH